MSAAAAVLVFEGHNFRYHDLAIQSSQQFFTQVQYVICKCLVQNKLFNIILLRNFLTKSKIWQKINLALSMLFFTLNFETLIKLRK